MTVAAALSVVREQVLPLDFPDRAALVAELDAAIRDRTVKDLTHALRTPTRPWTPLSPTRCRRAAPACTAQR